MNGTFRYSCTTTLLYVLIFLSSTTFYDSIDSVLMNQKCISIPLRPGLWGIPVCSSFFFLLRDSRLHTIRPGGNMAVMGFIVQFTCTHVSCPRLLTSCVLLRLPLQPIMWSWIFLYFPHGDIWTIQFRMNAHIHGFRPIIYS